MFKRHSSVQLLILIPAATRIIWTLKTSSEEFVGRWTLEERNKGRSYAARSRAAAMLRTHRASFSKERRFNRTQPKWRAAWWDD
ncbi:hypothetical protein WJX75_007768 [Coccomyxa subellipsoidea]|uniref:Secreted protein n=1 Tax=Coccomyxa subellipsoidea TaxID=248742 RepID=A0ABR2YE52_9CHLO